MRGSAVKRRHLVLTLTLSATLAASAAMAADWASLDPLSEARYGAGAAGVDSSIFVIGGHSIGDLATISRWTPPGGWNDLAAMPGTMLYPAVAASGGALYVF